MKQRFFSKVSHGLLFFFMLQVLAPTAFQNNTGVYAEESQQLKTISSEVFIQSEAAKLFQAEKFEESIQALDVLLKEYPGDPLLVRYRAIALSNLGRAPEAVKALEDLLLDQPDHLPTHYFLGQAYARSGQADKAAEQWRWVDANGEGTPYQFWARQDLQNFSAPGETPAAAAAVSQPIKRWNIISLYGYEYDSNVTLKPDDKSVSNPGDQNAGRQVANLGFRYRAVSRRDLALDLLYTVRQTAHDDSLNEFNFHSEEFGLNLRKAVNFGGRDYVAGLRYEFLLGILDTSIFSTRNRWQGSLETQYSEHTRTVYYDRLSLANYNDKGSEPSKTTRDGLYNDLGVTHYWYTSDFRRYIFFRQEFNSGMAEGNNFDSFGTTSRTGIFTPLFKRVDFETSTGLVLGFYPGFSSTTSFDSSNRRDIEWDVYNALTFHVTKRLALRGFYRFMDAANQNNIYDHTRQIGGAHVIYEWNF